MLNINKVLSSTDSYKQAFEKGLTGILENRTAGTFILACANIFQHPELFKKIKTFSVKHIFISKSITRNAVVRTSSPMMLPMTYR